MRNILGDVFLSFEQIQNTIFMLLQFIDVHIVKVTSTHRYTSTILLLLSALLVFLLQFCTHALLLIDLGQCLLLFLLPDYLLSVLLQLLSDV